ncbi:flagellar basal body-associated FliL family protein [Azospirillum thermophilum]|uniref:Flagellar protein FliL n=1 Tax=Azospirillum thermophilum TaxID=2202148 RepID=A0A2S2CLF9_9PROT|nr:flagellar basal body-associated FliL family protein [Azospirillum thermophilum]AWK85311.1 hypothetical protein DEW08_03180 [Azospirillum thermophilum]
MRFLHRRSNGEPVSLVPVITVGTLVALALLGMLGMVVAARTPSASRSGDSASSIPKKHYAVLPPMTFTLGGGDARTVDVKVLLEIDPAVSDKVADPYLPRIADQLSDRMRQIDAGQLNGAEGARLMKSAIAGVLSHEMRNVRVREILLDQMVVR